MNREFVNKMLFKCVDWLDRMSVTTIDDSYRKTSIFETLQAISKEIFADEEKEDGVDAEH